MRGYRQVATQAELVQARQELGQRGNRPETGPTTQAVIARKEKKESE